MENASKALIIAGAILLSILIITLGLSVYQNAKDTVGNANLTEQELQAFNAKFASYNGTRISGSQVNALIQTVISSNQKEIQDGTEKYVKINFPSQSGSSQSIDVDSNVITYSDTTLVNKVNTGNYYKVVFTYSNGRVSEINVEKVA